MSEPTSGGRQQPDPDPDRNQGTEPDKAQDEVPEPVFNDPTAPVWADPTTPIPPMPPAPTPPGATPSQGDQPASSPQTPPAAPPMSNPYAQQPPAQPYGQPYGQPPARPYGQPQPGQQYPAYGQQPYATGPHTETNASAIVLTIVSGIVMLSTCFIIGTPSLIFGIMALTSNSTDPVGSHKKAKTGWIIFAINFGVVVVLGVVGLGLLIATGNNLDSNVSY